MLAHLVTVYLQAFAIPSCVLAWCCIGGVVETVEQRLRDAQWRRSLRC